MTISHQGRRPAGYTIVEALVAAAILAVGVAAAASLALTMTAQEEANAQVARALNLQEQAARLYQLGLDPSVVTALLPPDSGVSSISFSAASVVVTNVGTVDQADCTMTFTAGAPLSQPGTTQNRTVDLIVVRPQNPTNPNH